MDSVEGLPSEAAGAVPPPADAFRVLPLRCLQVSDVCRQSPDDPHDEVTQENLVTSIGAQGLLNPLTVTPSALGPDVYDVVAGRRRFAAVQSLGWREVPCRIVPCQTTEQALLVAWGENSQRANMSLREKCQILTRLAEAHDQDLDAVARVAHLSRKTVDKYLKLGASLSQLLQEQFRPGHDAALTVGLAQMLAEVVPDQKGQEEVFQALKELPSNAQRKKVLAALEENPGQNVQEVVQQVQRQEADRKARAKTIKTPWVYDEDNQPLPIPEALWNEVAQMVLESEAYAGAAAAAMPKAKAKAKKRRH